MKQAPIDLSLLLHSLTIDQLQRLDAALTAANGGTVNIKALVAGMLATSPPVLARGCERRKSEIDGGRAYELTLDCSDLETARAQYEAEWVRADALALGGMSYEEAWAQIRRDARRMPIDL
jgi:hypothetical protein